MKDMMRYKDYYGSVHFDSDEPIFYGQVEFIKAVISYEAKDAVGIKKAFQDAVDDYFLMCQEQDLEPEKPFKGTFNVRTGHKLHEEIALAAEREDISINRFVCNVLLNACKKRQRKQSI
jgi:predicted HicB family RNase H-like nuclease